jgi:hypothetical protein
MSTDTTDIKDLLRIEAALDLVGDDLYKVEEIRRQLAGAEAEQRASVLAARDVGCSWDSIGQVFGITRQAAQQRFGA